MIWVYKLTPPAIAQLTQYQQEALLKAIPNSPYDDEITFSSYDDYARWAAQRETK